MKKLRLLLFEVCDRNCKGCCNKDWDLASLPKIDSFKGYDEIMLTGGEPMLRPQLVIDTAKKIFMESPKAKIYLYTAKVDDIEEVLRVMLYVDGLTVTLHEQDDVGMLRDLNAWFLYWANFFGYWSLRLNVFKGINISGLDLSMWQAKDNIEWIKDCPLPQDEVFMRL